MTPDRHRPTFHLTAQRGWINDPNGPIQHDGVYHVFAQFNPVEPRHQNIHWAHWTSTDLANWTEQPIALTPLPGSADADGCWSGSAIVVDGEILLVYSGYLAADRFQSVCVARPAGDGSWVADAAPVLLAPPPEADADIMRDPFLWRDDDGVKMLLGSGDTAGTPMGLVFASTDLASWRYVGKLSDGGQAAYAGTTTGAGWECPQLLRRDGRGVLVMSSWSPPSSLDGVFWSAGDLDGDRLEPHTVGRLDYGPDCYAADLFVDEADDALVWAWSWEACDQAMVDERGWAGVLTAPRLVTLDDHGLPRFSPAPHLETLRTHAPHRTTLDVSADQQVGVPDAAGRSLDIEARLTAGAGGTCWLRVLASADGSEFTEIGLDRGAGEVYLDRSHASTNPGARGGRYAIPVEAADGVDIRVLVDASIVEVFVDGKALTARVYPDSADSTAVVVGAAEAPAKVLVSCWTLA